MPRRTNAFQKVIYMLQKQLAGHAVVTESKLVRNQDAGTEVEVDVVVETTVGQVPFVIGIECTAGKRPATIEWIHQMYGKHKALPIHASVVVSKSGYTKSALKQAEALKIVAMTVEEAEAAVWTDVVGNLQNLALGAFSFTPKGGTAHYQRAPASAPDLVLAPSLMIQRGLPGDPVSLSDLIAAIVSDARVIRNVMTRWLAAPDGKRPNEFEFTVNWKPDNETVVTTNEGFFYKIDQLDISVTANVATTPLPMAAGSFGGAQIAHGTAENIFRQSGDRKRDVVVTLTRSESAPVVSQVMIPDFDCGGDRVFTMWPANDETEERT